MSNYQSSFHVIDLTWHWTFTAGAVRVAQRPTQRACSTMRGGE